MAVEFPEVARLLKSSEYAATLIQFRGPIAEQKGSLSMRNQRCGLFLLSVLLLSWAGYAQHKCDFKAEIDGADVPPCQELRSGGKLCPVLRRRNGMLHPNYDKVWAHPNEKNNFEVINKPGNLTRSNQDGCLQPSQGFEWVDPNDSENFAVKGQGVPVPDQELQPCVSVVPNGIRVLNSNTPCKQPEVQSAAAASSIEAVTVTGSYKHNSPTGQWSRGMPTTMYCGNSPESWVRGDAKLDPSSGLFSMTVQLETDSVSAGPKGRVVAALKDSSGRTIATATSDEIGTGGKDGSHAAIRNFTSHTTIDPAIATQVKSIYLDAQCTGSINRLLNITTDTLNDAFKIIVAAASL